MQSKDFFSDSSIVTTQPTVMTPYPAGQINAAMLYAAADKPTQQRLTKEALSSQCRALLAITAMENTLMLSVMEMHCNQQSPLGEQRYKMIVDAYVAGAVNKIVRW